MKLRFWWTRISIPQARIGELHGRCQSILTGFWKNLRTRPKDWIRASRTALAPPPPKFFRTDATICGAKTMSKLLIHLIVVKLGSRDWDWGWGLWCKGLAFISCWMSKKMSRNEQRNKISHYYLSILCCVLCLLTMSTLNTTSSGHFGA